MTNVAGLNIDIARLHAEPVETVVELVTINLANLWNPNGAMVSQPALYAYITAQCEVARVAVLRADQAVKDKRADAKDRHERAKSRLEEQRVDVFLEFARQPDPMPPAKPLPANRIEREVEQDARVRAARKDVLDSNPDTDRSVREAEHALVNAKVRLAALAAAERSFEHRRDVLVQLGARQNRELRNT